MFTSLLLLLGITIIIIIRLTPFKRRTGPPVTGLIYSPFTSHYPHRDPWGFDLLLATWRDFHSNRLAARMHRRHSSLGPTFVARDALGLGRKCIYTIDPANIRTITTAKFEDYGKASWIKEAAKHVGHGVLMNEGEAWKQSRAMLRPIFANNCSGEGNAMAMGDPVLLEGYVRDLVSVVRERDGQVVQFQELSARFTLDVVTDFLFGQSTRCLSSSDSGTAEEARRFLAFVKEFEPPSATFIAVGAVAWLELLPSYRRLIACVYGMKRFFRSRLDAIISNSRHPGTYERPKQSVGTSCFRMMRDDGVDTERIQAELQNIFFASFDTTTALLSNLVDVLSRRQDVQERLRKEVEGLGGRIPNRQELMKMTYLQWVINETLRLYTPVTTHSRRALVDTTLPYGGGSHGQDPVLVTAGTTVIWSIYALNRRRDFYGPDADYFRPERWEKLSARSSDFFMPFGSGPRACLGQKMATAEVAYVTVRLLQVFPAIRSCDNRKFVEAKAVSFYNGHGTLVVMVDDG